MLKQIRTIWNRIYQQFSLAEFPIPPLLEEIPGISWSNWESFFSIMSVEIVKMENSRPSSFFLFACLAHIFPFFVSFYHAHLSFYYPQMLKAGRAWPFFPQTLYFSYLSSQKKKTLYFRGASTKIVKLWLSRDLSFKSIMSQPKAKRRVGKYELGRTIGEGTFAKVKFARNSETGEPVAIKILDKEKVLKHKMAEQVSKYSCFSYWKWPFFLPYKCLFVPSSDFPRMFSYHKLPCFSRNPLRASHSDVRCMICVSLCIVT